MAKAAGLYYETHGSPDAPPLILSSGLGGSAGYWAPNMAALAEHFRVIAYDHRGTGRSDSVPPETTSIEDMAQDVLALMDALGIAEAGFVGHALGGMIGVALARRLTKLVVINGWSTLDPHTARCFDVRLDLLRHAGAAAYLRAQPLFLYPPDWISANDDRLTAETAGHLAHFPDPATVEKRISAVRAFRLDRFAAPVCEVMVIAADDDLLVPVAAGKAIAAAIPSARLVTMAWGGHACNVTDPDDFNAIVLDFLRS